MRALAIIWMLGAAAPAGAQPYRGLELTRDAQAAADAQAVRTRDIQITNDLAVLQARVQSDQALNNLQAARQSPALPAVPPDPKARTFPAIDLSQLATIPDAELAASNARIRAAADNRR